MHATVVMIIFFCCGICVGCALACASMARWTGFAVCMSMALLNLVLLYVSR